MLETLLEMAHALIHTLTRQRVRIYPLSQMVANMIIYDRLLQGLFFWSFYVLSSFVNKKKSLSSQPRQ